MADFIPTPAQKEAIRNRGGALLVSAAAGSGKTRVLTERLMSYLTEPEVPRDIDAFLVITYTRAAAAELRSRITDELSERIAADPTNRRLRRQSALVQRAKIGTIHSFCTTLLRESSPLVGLSPDFAVAEEDRARELKSIALGKVMDAAYEDPDPDFLALTDSVGAGRDDSRLAELVLTLHNSIQSHARPEAWAEAQTEALSNIADDAGDTPWGRELLRAAADDADYWAAELDRLLTLVSADDYAYIMKAYGGSIADTADALRAFSRASVAGWDAARACLPIPFPRLGPLRNPPDTELVDFVRARRDACKHAAKKMAAGFTEPSETLIRDLNRTAPAMRALLRLVLRFGERFAAEKRRRSLVDFSDLEHFAVRLLTDENGAPTKAAEEVSARFAEVMVDEYQDISEVQDLIIRAVSSGGEKCFMVGDVKQSIYRFRLADPTIFLDKYLTFKDAAAAAQKEPRRVLLQENFRSRREVLDAVNAVFTNIMSTDLGELDYDENAALKRGASYCGEVPVPELLCFSLPEADDDERPDKVALEAAAVARRILRLIADGVKITDHGEERPAGFGDIAVLLEAANVNGGIFRRELMKAGIPVLSEQSGGFFGASEIAVMISLLSVIDNPRQDVPLISVLRSPLFGFTPDELSAIRVCDRKSDFFTALTAAAASDPKCAAFLETLERFRRFAPDAELGGLIRELYSKLDCMAVASAAADGAARRNNLMRLFELACKFEQKGYKGLHRFIGWLRSMEERGEEPRSGAESAGGAVRIMSVHKSKGLEFPIVFYCNTARQFNKSDTRGSVLVHPLLGLGPKRTDTDRGIEYPTLAWRAVAHRMLRETLSEEMRLVYVAMTRARERLFITCSLSDPAKTIEKIALCVTQPMAPQVLMTMASPALWLIAAVLADGETHLRLRVEPAEGEETRAESAAEAPETRPDSEAPPDLAARLDWAYPYAASVSLPSKVTATELKSLGAEDPENAPLLPRGGRTFRRPDFLRAEKGLTAAEKGTATHLALRYIDFSNTGSEAAIKSELARLCEAGYLSEKEAAAVDAPALSALFSSVVGKRILHADAAVREFPFTLLRPASELFPGGGDDELLLQGVVDCFIEENGTLTVIDYKTDSVAEKDVPARAEFYKGQLIAYARALRRITGKPIKECILYFLRPKTAFFMPPPPEN